MKKAFVFITVIFILILVFGCSKITDRASEVIEESKEAGGEEPETTVGLPAGFPGTVPIHSQADINESIKEITDGAVSYYINMGFDGEIIQLADWYEGELEKNWQIDSISSSDYDDWSDFYVDAQDSEYYLSIYLYQDAGSSYVTIDINAVRKTGEIGETEEAAEETEEAAEEATSGTAVTYSGELEDADIAFICASVGSAWNIGEHFPNLNITVRDEYQFDKGDAVRDILRNDRPDIMIIKECAAYFPPQASMEAYKDLIRDWVNLCRGGGVIPVLTTVVPIDPDNTSNSEGQLESILEFNDWIHEYCEHENISVLDLEASLRVSIDNRTLNPRYDSGDGLHPNDLAYQEKLDGILIPALERALEIGY